MSPDGPLEPMPVKRQRIVAEIVYFDDGKGDDWESLIVNALVEDGSCLLRVVAIQTEELTP